MLIWNTNTVKRNTEALLDASTQTGLEINNIENKYMFPSRQQDAGQSSLKIKYTVR
jgi:hypothetical protein